MKILSTSRLILRPLTIAQLELCLSALPSLEEQFGVKMTDHFLTDRVFRAIRMKIEKMQREENSKHAWLTYWLIIIRNINIGAGMLGFKGYPTEEGSTEIGYGIDPAYQNKGYMTEAVRALADWAFAHPFCNAITATDVRNPASERLLEKLGAQLVSQSDGSTSWIMKKSPH